MTCWLICGDADRARGQRRCDNQVPTPALQVWRKSSYQQEGLVGDALLRVLGSGKSAHGLTVKMKQVAAAPTGPAVMFQLAFAHPLVCVVSFNCGTVCISI